MNTTASPARFEATTSDGAVLHAFQEGHGQTLLLISGLSGTAGFWNDIASTFARSFRVIRFDQRGIGGSTRGDAECTIDRLAEDCLAVLDAAGIHRAVVLGHSTGGCIGQALARQAPDRLDGLILSGSWLRPSLYMGGLSGHAGPSSTPTRTPMPRHPCCRPIRRPGSRRTGTSTRPGWKRLR